MDYDDDNSVIYLPQNMCRACLTSLKPVSGIDIAENFIQETERWNIIEQFQYFNVQINVDDGKPQQICRDCFYNLRLATSFLVLCQKSQAVLDTYIRLTENNESSEPEQEEEVCGTEDEVQVRSEGQELSEQQVIEALAEQGILITYVEQNAEGACLEPGMMLNLDGQQIHEIIPTEQLLAQYYIEQLQREQECDDLIEECPEFIEEELCIDDQAIIEYTYVQPEEEVVVNGEISETHFVQEEEERLENMEVEEEVIQSGAISESSGDCNFEESSADSASDGENKYKSVQMDNDVENAIDKYLVQRIKMSSRGATVDEQIPDQIDHNHDMNFNENSESTLKCVECEAEFVERSELRTHFIAEHCTLSSHDLDSKLTCHLCSDKCEDAMDFHIHMESHGERCSKECSICNSDENQQNTEGTCQHCMRQFPTNRELEEHTKEHNVRIKMFKCDLCGKSFMKKPSLNKHKRSHEKSTIHPCQHCGKEFLKETHLKLHLRKHTENRPYKCEICGDDFIARANLVSHSKKVHKDEETKIKCEMCQDVFTDKNTYELHMRIHSVDKNPIGKEDKLPKPRSKMKNILPLICEDCGLGFKDSTEFTRHLRLHQESRTIDPNGHKRHWAAEPSTTPPEPTSSRPNGKNISPVEKSFICSICSGAFSTIEALRTHEQTHRTTEKRETGFSCDFCRKEFTTYAALANHVFKHEGLELPKSIGFGEY